MRIGILRCDHSQLTLFSSSQKYCTVPSNLRTHYVLHLKIIKKTTTTAAVTLCQMNWILSLLRTFDEMLFTFWVFSDTLNGIVALEFVSIEFVLMKYTDIFVVASLKCSDEFALTYTRKKRLWKFNQYFHCHFYYRIECFFLSL